MLKAWMDEQEVSSLKVVRTTAKLLDFVPLERPVISFLLKSYN